MPDPIDGKTEVSCRVVSDIRVQKGGFTNEVQHADPFAAAGTVPRLMRLFRVRGRRQGRPGGGAQGRTFDRSLGRERLRHGNDGRSAPGGSRR